MSVEENWVVVVVQMQEYMVGDQDAQNAVSIYAYAGVLERGSLSRDMKRAEESHEHVMS